ncbi:diaminobutyrate acetyltransferase [Vibrio sp. ZSDZ65]|uniref:L-2,4-diaminobutyric acid acetyltransferase n=1 Tax=Vibrio qingdaonensis TaxID=2829491 RepID=A0A9X3CPE3_9VIBR|nr:diaminobutyrate acetyltransferase [Vibrio qingdaonensis]MCW8347231.1 diaminobutyrate acetyltransferase [Vibrio qingdaonensis]
MITSAPWVMYPETSEKPSKEWTFLEPTGDDGNDIFGLIAVCPPLDMNSSYCNFLQSTHFSRTCVIARYDDDIAGFISAYRKPDDPETLFVWQVAVSPNYRGKGLAFNMLSHLLNRDILRSVVAVETTITKQNSASWALFKKLDSQQGQQGEVSTFLDEQIHFKGEHDTEFLYRIPLKNTQKIGN